MEEKADAFLFGERGKFGPPGVIGGKSGALNKFSYPAGDGSKQSPPMVSKMVGIRLEKSQCVRLETPGGGGYGDACKRDPLLVAKDVRLGYVTTNSALEDYKCSVSNDGIVNQRETDRLRGAS